MKTPITSMALGLILFGMPLIAGGEYERWHAGYQVGFGWSPQKSYSVLNAELDGGRQLSGSLGIVFRFSPWKIGSWDMGIDGDVFKAISLGKKKNAPTVEQIGYRGTVRFIHSFKSRTSNGGYVFFGPTMTRSQTSYDFDLSVSQVKTTRVTQNLAGACLGIGTRRYNESSITHYEMALHQTSSGAAGLKAGGLTLEFRGGITW